MLIKKKYRHQNKKQNFVSSGVIILEIPFTNSVPTPHVVSIVSLAIGSGVYWIWSTTTVLTTIYFSFYHAIVYSTLEDFIATEDASTCGDTIAGKVVPFCSDVYPVSPAYFLIIDLSWM